MTFKHSRLLGTGLWILPFVVMAGWPAGAGTDCENAAKVTVNIGEDLSVTPESIEIFLDTSAGGHGRVCWLVEGLTEDLTVHFGPKPGSGNLLPNRERTVKLPRTFANSGRPSQTGTWAYSVWVTRDGETIMEVDPEIIIKDKGGGS